MKICITLVGLPGSGKTTWRNEFLKSCINPEQWAIISSDDWIEAIAEENKITYKAAWDANKDRIESVLSARLASAVMGGKNIIWDQTNLTYKKRCTIRRKLKEYKHYLVSFLDTPFEEISKRNEARKLTGRDIPDTVLNVMRSHAVNVDLLHEEGAELLDRNVSNLVDGEFYD